MQRNAVIDFLSNESLRSVFSSVRAASLTCGCVSLPCCVWINLNRLSSHLCILTFLLLPVLQTSQFSHSFYLTFAILCCPSVRNTRCQFEGNSRAFPAGCRRKKRAGWCFGRKEIIHRNFSSRKDRSTNTYANDAPWLENDYWPS